MSSSSNLMEYEEELCTAIRSALHARDRLRSHITSFFIYKNETLKGILNKSICCSCRENQNTSCALRHVVGIPGSHWKRQLIEMKAWEGFIKNIDRIDRIDST